jgi:hypothetical protein
MITNNNRKRKNNYKSRSYTTPTFSTRRIRTKRKEIFSAEQKKKSQKIGCFCAATEREKGECARRTVTKQVCFQPKALYRRKMPGTIEAYELIDDVSRWLPFLITFAKISFV